jgi:hypothetical protein
MSSDYIYEIDNSDNQGLISELIKKINAWSNNIPHHPYQNFGDSIKVESLLYAPAYPVLLDTQYEKRSKSEEFIPYDQRKIPERKYFNLNDINVWEWNLKTIEKYTDDEFNFFATGSEYIEDCHRCGAKGWITCTQCHGEKSITCPKCNGTGDTKCTSCSGSGKTQCSHCNGRGFTGGTQKCSSCGGSGKVYAYESSWEKNVFETCSSCHGSGEINNSVNCSSCRGTGKTQCRSCGGKGKVTCSKCGGNGRITCPKCSGSGRNVCPTCEGKQQLLHYINLNQTLNADTKDAAMLHQKLSAKFPEFKDNWSDYESELLFNTREEEISLEHLPQDTHLDELFNRHLKEAKSQCNSSQKILFQDLDIRKIDVWLLNYTFEGKTYCFAFQGKNHTIIPGLNPISEFSSQLVNTAYKAAESRSYVKAYRITKKSKDIDVYEQKETVKNQLYELREKIAQPYFFGAKIGGVIAALIIGFMSFIYFRDVNFIFSWAEFINRPTNFLFNIHPWIMSIITAWIVFKISKFSGNISDQIFGVLPGSHLRLSLGIITSIVFSFLILAIVLLINSTGLTIVVSLVGWLGFWVLKIIFYIIGIIIGIIIWLFKLIF